MRIIRSISLALIFLLLFSSSSKADSIPNKMHLSLQLSPLALIDFYNGSSYRIGSQLVITENIAISADFGGYFKNFNYLKNNKGFYSFVAFKYRLPNSPQSWISLSYSYKQQSFNYHDSFEQDPNTPVVVHVQKYVNCLNLNYETNAILFRKSYINFFAGVGIRFRNVQSLQTKHEFDELKDGGDSQTLYFVLIPGKNTWLNLNAGIRLGFYLF
ncbi:hypothetical protein [Fluviicola sp.]|uniref:hypothetical protein n=1 Tax=Fluviicola sp. TaxID=1917219 RepID=UPI003D2858CB